MAQAVAGPSGTHVAADRRAEEWSSPFTIKQCYCRTPANTGTCAGVPNFRVEKELA